MATSQTLRKVGQVFSSLFLGLTGSWLLVICVGGLLTLGALSLFHLGVLLSVGCIGVCLLVAGVCWLYDALSRDTTQKRRSPAVLEDEARGWSFEADEEDLKQPASQPAKLKEPFHRPRSSVKPNVDESELRLRRKSADPSLNQWNH